MLLCKSLGRVDVSADALQLVLEMWSGEDLEKAEVLINVDHEEPSWWVWVSEEMVPNNVEEKSRIDNENYVIVSAEHVVDGVATFMARCIVANPKALVYDLMVIHFFAVMTIHISKLTMLFCLKMQNLTPMQLQKGNTCGSLPDHFPVYFEALLG